MQRLSAHDMYVRTCKHHAGRPVERLTSWRRAARPRSRIRLRQVQRLQLRVSVDSRNSSAWRCARATWDAKYTGSDGSRLLHSMCVPCMPQGFPLTAHPRAPCTMAAPGPTTCGAAAAAAASRASTSLPPCTTLHWSGQLALMVGGCCNTIQAVAAPLLPADVYSVRPKVQRDLPYVAGIGAPNPALPLRTLNPPCRAPQTDALAGGRAGLP